MSSAILPSPPEPAADPPAEADLATLRAELDRLDDALHATLMRRAEVVGAVAGLHAKRATPLRPGREAAIIRRLLARHHGALPRHAIVRLWRELLAATTAMQGRFALAVCETDPGSATVAIAREHFGALTPLHCHRTPGHAIRAVSEGTAAVAVLPMPAQDEPDAAAWWPALLHQDGPRLHIVGRLPFWASRPEGTPDAQALVVSAADPDPSGEDRSLLGLELATGISRARLGAALTAAGFAPREIFLRRAGGAPAAQALVEVEGFVAGDDPRLSAIGPVRGPPVVLGAYAVPIEERAA
jgi:chorismate mutase